ncbi:MAG: NAD(+) synthase [bacterium]
MNPDDRLKELKSRMEIEAETLSHSLEDSIRRCVEKLEREGVILGLSGGVDSAVVAALCKRAVGPEKTLALIMPDKDSKKEHIEDAMNFAGELNIETKSIDISPHLERLGVYKLFPLNKLPLPEKLKEALVKKAYIFYEERADENPFSASILGFKDKEYSSYLKKVSAYYRIKHRLRMVLLYLYGELENKLVVGAANKTEYNIGYFVKYGCDHSVDIMPLLNLYKTQVRELAQYLNIPPRIVEKPPSPDIIPGIVDEEAIGIPYEKLDLILLALEKGWGASEIADVLKIEERKVIYVKSLIQRSEHMRKIYTSETGSP